MLDVCRDLSLSMITERERMHLFAGLRVTMFLAASDLPRSLLGTLVKGNVVSAMPKENAPTSSERQARVHELPPSKLNLKPVFG
jgi:hypothetical protein